MKSEVENKDKIMVKTKVKTRVRVLGDAKVI